MARISAPAGATSHRGAAGGHRDRGDLGPLASAALLDPGDSPESPALRALRGAHRGALHDFDVALQRHAKEPALRPPLSRLAKQLAEYPLYPPDRGDTRSLHQHDDHLQRIGHSAADPGAP